MEIYETIENLASLIDNNTPETNQLEYKAYRFDNGKISAQDRDALVKEIVAMANGLGGRIILGIEEQKSESALRLIGVTCPDLDEFERTIQQSIYAKIRPRLYGVRVSSIAVNTDSVVLIISVPQSYSRPHAYNNGSKDEFYVRQSNSIASMTVDDLRQQFSLASSFQKMIHTFRQERISAVLSNESLSRFRDGAKLLIHIIPLWSLLDGNHIDVMSIRKSGYDSPLCGTSYQSGFNIDGWYSKSVQYGKTTIYSYIQYFRNGIVEIVDSMDSRGSSKEYMTIKVWSEYEKSIYKKLEKVSELLTKAGAPKPWYIYISLLDVKGYMSDGDYYSGVPIDRNYIHAMEGIWHEETMTLEEVMFPVFNSLANVFNKERSYVYGPDGRYYG